MTLQNVKSIMIGFGADESGRSSALDYGVSLAMQADAHVSVHAVTLKLTAVHPLIPKLTSHLISEENARRRHLATVAVEAALQEALANGISCTAETTQMAYPDALATFASRARVHDLTVLDRDPELLSLDQGLLDEVLFHSGHPVILVSADATAFICRRVLVAWDGSPKAARAVKDALPFLRAAEETEIVAVTGEKDLANAVPGAELAPYLERHGVRVSVRDRVALEGDVAATLRDEAAGFGADLVVMGAFVHSRLRELILGGVTRSMLKQCSVPLLLAH